MGTPNKCPNLTCEDPVCGTCRCPKCTDRGNCVLVVSEFPDGIDDRTYLALFWHLPRLFGATVPRRPASNKAKRKLRLTFGVQAEAAAAMAQVTTSQRVRTAFPSLTYRLAPEEKDSPVQYHRGWAYTDNGLPKPGTPAGKNYLMHRTNQVTRPIAQEVVESRKRSRSRAVEGERKQKQEESGTGDQEEQQAPATSPQRKRRKGKKARGKQGQQEEGKGEGEEASQKKAEEREGKEHARQPEQAEAGAESSGTDVLVDGRSSRARLQDKSPSQGHVKCQQWPATMGVQLCLTGSGSNLYLCPECQRRPKPEEEKKEAHSVSKDAVEVPEEVGDHLGAITVPTIWGRLLHRLGRKEMDRGWTNEAGYGNQCWFIAHRESLRGLGVSRTAEEIRAATLGAMEEHRREEYLEGGQYGKPLMATDPHTKQRQPWKTHLRQQGKFGGEPLRPMSTELYQRAMVIIDREDNTVTAYLPPSQKFELGVQRQAQLRTTGIWYVERATATERRDGKQHQLKRVPDDAMVLAKYQWHYTALVKKSRTQEGEEKERAPGEPDEKKDQEEGPEGGEGMGEPPEQGASGRKEAD